MSADEMLLALPLSQLGRAAVAAPDPSDSDPLLQEFGAAIAPYSTDRANVDWSLVQRLGTALGAERCDLKIYGYLCLAVFAGSDAEDSPYLPLGAVLHSLGDVIEHGWARCTPRSDTRRQAQLKWLSEELAGMVKSRPPKPAQSAAFMACLRAAEQSAALAGAALNLGYALLRELREALSEHQRNLPAASLPAAAPASAKASVSPPPISPAVVPAAVAPAAAAPALAAPVAAAVFPVSAAAPPATATAPPDTAQLSTETIADGLAGLVVQLVERLRTEAPLDPAAFWLLRTLRWANHDLLRAERLAEVQSNKGRTQIPLPHGHTRLSKDLPRRLGEGASAAAAVIAECEELFAANPLWLDLQRYVAEGLQALQAEAALAVVKSQVQLLLHCCPQIGELRFADRDGTPFADAQTLSWLATLQTPTAAGDLPGPPQPPFGAAADLLPEGLLPGVQFLQKQLAQAPSGILRFELRLRLSELLLAHNRSDIAMPCVELLLEAIEAHRLADWQPELCNKALRLAVKTARAAELSAARRALLWSRLCQLMPTAALEMEPEILPP